MIISVFIEQSTDLFHCLRSERTAMISCQGSSESKHFRFPVFLQRVEFSLFQLSFLPCRLSFLPPRLSFLRRHRILLQRRTQLSVRCCAAIWQNDRKGHRVRVEPGLLIKFQITMPLLVHHGQKLCPARLRPQGGVPQFPSFISLRSGSASPCAARPAPAPSCEGWPPGWDRSRTRGGRRAYTIYCPA